MELELEFESLFTDRANTCAKACVGWGLGWGAGNRVSASDRPFEPHDFPYSEGGDLPTMSQGPYPFKLLVLLCPGGLQCPCERLLSRITSEGESLSCGRVKVVELVAGPLRAVCGVSSLPSWSNGGARRDVARVLVGWRTGEA